jgi:hypothetical protein
MAKSGLRQSKSPSQLIDERIKELADWRGLLQPAPYLDQASRPRRRRGMEVARPFRCGRVTD